MTNDVVIGVFDNPVQAGEAVRRLVEAGFSEDRIGLVSPEKGPRAAVSGSTDDLTHWQTGAAVGAITGTTLALAVTAVALPGIGPVVAGGTLATMLATGSAGAVTGGLVGSLVGMGLPSETASQYEQLLVSGQTIVSVKTGDRSIDAREILHRQGAISDFVSEGTTALR